MNTITKLQTKCALDVRVKDRGFVECALEMLDEPLVIAAELFMWFSKASLR